MSILSSPVGSFINSAFSPGIQHPHLSRIKGKPQSSSIDSVNRNDKWNKNKWNDSLRTYSSQPRRIRLEDSEWTCCYCNHKYYSRLKYCEMCSMQIEFTCECGVVWGNNWNYCAECGNKMPCDEESIGSASIPSTTTISSSRSVSPRESSMRISSRIKVRHYPTPLVEFKTLQMTKTLLEKENDIKNSDKHKDKHNDEEKQVDGVINQNKKEDKIKSGKMNRQHGLQRRTRSEALVKTPRESHKREAHEYWLLDDLIRELISAGSSVQFRDTFLLTMQFFTTASHVLSTILEVLSEMPVIIGDCGLNKEWQSNCLRGFSVLKHWTKTYPQDFDENMTKEIFEWLTEYPPKSWSNIPFSHISNLQTIARAVHMSFEKARTDLLYLNEKLKSSDDLTKFFSHVEFWEIAKQKVIKEREEKNKTKQKPVCLLNWEPRKIAEQLLLLSTKRVLDCSGPRDFLQKGKSKLEQGTVPSQLKISNQVSFWVTTQVLSMEPSDLPKMISHWIKICRECYSLKSYTNVFEIIYGINHNSVYRLRGTNNRKGWFHDLSRKRHQEYTKFCEFASPSDNYKFYRIAASNVKGHAHLPYFGVLYKDLIGVEEGGRPLVVVHTTKSEESRDSEDEEEWDVEKEEQEEKEHSPIQSKIKSSDVNVKDGGDSIDKYNIRSKGSPIGIVRGGDDIIISDNISCQDLDNADSGTSAIDSIIGTNKPDGRYINFKKCEGLASLVVSTLECRHRFPRWKFGSPISSDHSSGSQGSKSRRKESEWSTLVPDEELQKIILGQILTALNEGQLDARSYEILPRKKRKR